MNVCACMHACVCVCVCVCASYFPLTEEVVVLSGSIVNDFAIVEVSRQPLNLLTEMVHGKHTDTFPNPPGVMTITN